MPLNGSVGNFVRRPTRRKFRVTTDDGARRHGKRPNPRLHGVAQRCQKRAGPVIDPSSLVTLRAKPPSERANLRMTALPVARTALGEGGPVADHMPIRTALQRKAVVKLDAGAAG